MTISRYVPLLLIAALLLHLSFTVQAQDRPNILWITSEDNGQEMGAYGDTYATTPNLDKLAARGLRYLNAWSTAPVCAPARSAIITGMYPYSIGSHNMRSMVPLPDQIKMYPQYLRDAGYYCTNNSKEDYNLIKPGKVWDESSRKAHWKNRAEGQPFFAIFNYTVSHESQVRRRPHKPVHDPADVPLPPYHPDTPDMRRDWAQYYDKVTEMDTMAGNLMRELEEAGLADDTIIFYYGDHGAGMPRHKRWPYQSGLQVPLIVHVPDKWKHLAPKGYVAGGTSDRLVGFVDLAPTLLSLIGMKPPKYMQGQAIMGKHETKPPKYMFGFRDRMDERYDMVRTVTDGEYQYIRHYMPHLPYGQYLEYMFQTPATVSWKAEYDAERLESPMTEFWEQKPFREIFNIRKDPDNIHPLMPDDVDPKMLRNLRKALDDHLLEVRDLGFLPEPDWQLDRGEMTPYEYGHSISRDDLARVKEAAELATVRNPRNIGKLHAGLKEDNSAIRYWSALGIYMLGEPGVRESLEELRAHLTDASPSVEITVARALAHYGEAKDLDPALDVLIATPNGQRPNGVMRDAGFGFNVILYWWLCAEMRLGLFRFGKAPVSWSGNPFDVICRYPPSSRN